MGGFEDVDEAIIAGARIGDADIASDAAIKPIKTKKRSFFIPLALGNIIFTGNDVVIADAGAFPVLQLPDSNSGTLTSTLQAPKAEVSPGDKAKLHIWWYTTATSGSVRFVVDIKPAIEGISGLGSAIQKAVLSDARASGLQLIEAIIEYPAAIFSNNQLIGIKLERNPDNTLDDLGTNAFIVAIYLEMQGRC